MYLNLIVLLVMQVLPVWAIDPVSLSNTLTILTATVEIIRNFNVLPSALRLCVIIRSKNVPLDKIGQNFTHTVTFSNFC
jgi:hypothetical protein